MCTLWNISSIAVLPRIDTTAARWDALVAPVGHEALDETFVAAAGAASRLLPADAHDALVDFADRGHRSGALLITGIDMGEIPATPPRPGTHRHASHRHARPGQASHRSEFVLLTVARRLGQPVGYAPEHGGDIVQDIVPTPDSAGRQVSTSSDVELMFHTETAFHPHRPRYLVLLCLRGDPAAATTMASVHDLIDHLDERTVAVMFEPRFRTAVDESFLAGRTNQLGPPRPLLEGTVAEPTFVFDADLMVGTDAEAEAVVHVVADAIRQHQTSVVLTAGDLLVIDNHVAVHGRSPFTPRFDGTDRWVQRTFVVPDLAPSAGDRTGRVITTQFGHDAILGG
jgi:L-asparagine oxygenase